MSAMATAGQKSRIGWVDTGRGLAILLVVLYHAANWFAVPSWQHANIAVSSLRMPLFFAISGMFAAKWVVGPWSKLWLSKISLFTWVVLVWSAVGVCVLWLGQQMQDIPYGAKSAVKNYLMGPVRPQLELWFLWALALFFVVAKVLRHVPIKMVLGVSAVASAVALSGLDLGNTGWNGALRYFFFFVLGLAWRDRLMAWGSNGSSRSHFSVIAAWVSLTTASWLFALSSVPALYFVNCVLGMLAGIAISRLLSRIAILSRLGQQTLPIYLAHTPVVLVLAYGSWRAFGDPSPGAWGGVLVPVAAALAIVTSLSLHRWLQTSRWSWLYRAPTWFRELPVHPLVRRMGRLTGVSGS